LINSNIDKGVNHFEKISRKNIAAQRLCILENIPSMWLDSAGGWSIDLRVYEYLMEIMDRYQKPRVLEFGSGMGSKILHRMALNRSGFCKSIEHDLNWYNKSRLDLARHGLLSTNSLIYAPLIDLIAFDIATKFYSMDWLNSDDFFDIVIVDGPPQSTSNLSRLAAFPMIAKNLGENFHIILDDYERPIEKKIAQIWKSTIPELEYSEVCFEKSICVITKPIPI
jgi:hypothetical protein